MVVLLEKDLLFSRYSENENKKTLSGDRCQSASLHSIYISEEVNHLFGVFVKFLFYFKSYSYFFSLVSRLNLHLSSYF